MNDTTFMVSVLAFVTAIIILLLVGCEFDAVNRRNCGIVLKDRPAIEIEAICK